MKLVKALVTIQTLVASDADTPSRKRAVRKASHPGSTPWLRVAPCFTTGINHDTMLKKQSRPDNSEPMISHALIV